MIRKDVVKFWVPAQELLKKLGFKEGQLLMKADIMVDPNAPLGYQVQGIDVYVETSTEVQE